MAGARRVSERRSSLFDIQRAPGTDTGSSVLSLTDVPSITKRGISFSCLYLFFPIVVVGYFCTSLIISHFMIERSR